MDLRTGAFPRRRAVALAIAATLAAGQAGAATINVTSLLDGPATTDTVCTLREALESLATGAAAFGCAATGAFGTTDTVTFGVTGTIALDPVQGSLDVVSDSTITGPGAAQLTLSGGGNVPVVYVTNATAAISGVTIANGRGGKGAGGVTAIGA
ncbi:MAG TPA: hypothetical protein VFL14_09905, partial [Xanthomonadales bacterium]|nr:hypothetical protein [Xanthomonadales bacterium]